MPDPKNTTIVDVLLPCPIPTLIDKGQTRHRGAVSDGIIQASTYIGKQLADRAWQNTMKLQPVAVNWVRPQGTATLNFFVIYKGPQPAITAFNAAILEKLDAETPSHVPKTYWKNIFPALFDVRTIILVPIRTDGMGVQVGKAGQSIEECFGSWGYDTETVKQHAYMFSHNETTSIAYFADPSNVAGHLTEPLRLKTAEMASLKEHIAAVMNSTTKGNKPLLIEETMIHSQLFKHFIIGNLRFMISAQHSEV